MSRNQDVHSIPLENFMDQDLGLSIMNASCNDKNIPAATPVSVSLPIVEPATRTVLPLGQFKKTTSSTSTQVLFNLNVLFRIFFLFQ